MKTLLIVLFLFISLVNWGQSSILQEKSSDNFWETITETSYQVKAGQGFNFQLVISEDAAFTADTHSIQLELVSSTSDNAVFNDPGSIIYHKDPENSQVSTFEFVSVEVDNTFFNSTAVVDSDEGPHNDVLKMENIQVDMPSSISSETTIELRVTHTLGGSTTTETLLTFEYQQPVLSIEVPNPLACRGDEVSCSVTIVPDLGYTMEINGSSEEIDFTSGAYDFAFDDYVQIIDPANESDYGKSNVVNIGSAFFEPLNLTKPNGETNPVCNGDYIQFEIETECEINNNVIEIRYDGNDITADVVINSSANGYTFYYAPTADGELVVDYNGQQASLHIEVLPGYDDYIFSAFYSFPKTKGSVNMRELDYDDLTPPINGNFPVINLDGQNYKVRSNGDNDFEFYRYNFPYETPNYANVAGTVFNFDEPGVSVGWSRPNRIDLIYGKHYPTYSKTCWDTSSTNIVLLNEDIFVPQDGFCSNDNTDYTIEISDDLQDYEDALDLDPGVLATVDYAGYKLETDGVLGDLVPGDVSFTFNPSNQSGSNFKVYAIANLKLSESESCPDQWNRYASYSTGDTVLYNGTIYEALQNTPVDGLGFERSGVGEKELKPTLYPVPGIHDSYWEEKGACSVTSGDELATQVAYANKSFTVYAPRENGTILNLEDTYCETNQKILLQSNHSINQITSSIGSAAVSFTEQDNNYYFTPENVISGSGAETTQLTLTYTDDLGCIGTYQTQVTVDPAYNVDQNVLFSLENQYCPVDNNLSIETNFSIENLAGPGVFLDDTDNNYYFNPFTALGNADDANIQITLEYRDHSGCKASYVHPVEIDRFEGVDQSAEFLNLDTNFCLAHVDYDLNLAAQYSIHNISGDGVSEVGNQYKFNASDAYANSGEGDVLINLEYTDENSCPVSKEITFNIDDNHVNATTELLFEDKYCAVDNPIHIQLNHTDHDIVNYIGVGINVNNDDEVLYNPFEFYRKDRNSIYKPEFFSNKVSVTFKDERECPYTKSYQIETSGSFADRKDELSLNDAYCFGNKDWPLSVNQYFSIDSISGKGIDTTQDRDYFFNASDIYGSIPQLIEDVVPITLYYQDSAGCAYYKNYDIRLDASVVDDDSYLDIDSVYCAQDEEIGITLINTGHTITEWSGTGLDSDNGAFYYNPTDIYKGDTTLYYNNQNYYDTVKMAFLDGNKCPYQKEYIVSINGNNANKDVTLNIDDTYCFANKNFPLNSNFNVDTLVGPGVDKNDDGYFFNAYEPFASDNTNFEEIELSLYYRDNDGCAYKNIYEVTLDSSIVDASTELLFEDQYCAVDEDIYTPRNHNNHTLDDIWGTGVEIRGSEVYFNPFDNYRDSIELVYGDVVLDSTVTARFLDNDLCPYLKTYPIKIAGKFADQNAELNVRDEYCFANKDYNLESNYSIDSLIGTGIRKQAHDYKFNAWLPYQASAIDFKEIDFSLFYRDTSGCAYKKVFDVTLDSSIVDGSTELLFDTAYCVVDENIHVPMNQQYHTLDEIWGKGVSVEDSAVYYNPFENFRDTTSLIYGDIVLDSLIVARFLDEDLCPYLKTYPVKIAGKYADQNATLNVRDEYCFANKEYTLESNYSIDSLTGIGIDEENGFFTFNALPPFQDSATNFEEVDFSLYYRDNDGCAYKKVFNVTLDSSIVDASTDLDFDAYYCAVNEEKEIGRNQYDHTLEAISGQGISLIDDVVYYNPYEVFNGSTDLIYSEEILQTNVSVEFLDEDLCPYIKTYTVTTSGVYGQDGVLIDFDEQYCQFDDSVKLRGTFLQIDSIEILGHNIDAVNGSFYFNPSADEFANAVTDVEDVLYHYYKDNNNCMGRSLHPYTLNLKPQAGFSFEDLCVGDSTQFTDLSTIEGEGTLNQWNWKFGDLDIADLNGLPSDIIEEGMHNGQTMGTYATPRHQYDYAGVYTASLSVSSDLGCSDTAIDTIIIGGYPVPDFTIENFVQSFPTYLQNKTKAEEFDKVEQCTWKLNDSIEDIITAGFDSLVHTFNHSGIHHVELAAITGNGCEASVTREIPIFPYIEISNENVYSAHFDNDQFGSGWINASEYEDTLVSGWRLDTVFSPFSAYPNISGNFWITGDPDDNIHSENGWIESPSFDISALEFPLLSIDIYQSVEPGRDGAVVQYTLDDGQSWHLLANKENTVNQGMNWYNSSGVVSNPGNQSEGPFEAWSANNYEWQTARFPLDNIRSLASDSDARSVRFRVAYASDQGNSPDAEVAGFAFDNFELTSRSRIVLLEQFANIAHDANLARKEGEWLDVLTQHGEAEEAVAMRYHNYIDEYYDSLYYLNTPDISSRSMEYGAYLSQLTMVDGIHRCLATNEQSAEEEAKSFYQVRRLADKRFNIDVETRFENDSLIIEAEIQKLKDTLTYRPGTEKCAVRMALVQKGYTLNDSVYKNVVVELLPVGIGNVVGTIPDTLSKNGVVHVRGAWQPDNVTTIGQEYRLVVYIQGIWGVDEVHQVYFEDLDNTLIPQVDIQTLKNPEDHSETQKPVWEQQNQLMLYPIPASTDVYLQWNTLLDRKLEYRIMDASGRIVKEGRVAEGINKTAISVESLSEGTYVLMLSDMNDTYMEKKILIVLRNK